MGVAVLMDRSANEVGDSFHASEVVVQAGRLSIINNNDEDIQSTPPATIAYAPRPAAQHARTYPYVENSHVPKRRGIILRHDRTAEVLA